MFLTDKIVWFVIFKYNRKSIGKYTIKKEHNLLRNKVIILLNCPEKLKQYETWFYYYLQNMYKLLGNQINKIVNC